VGGGKKDTTGGLVREGRGQGLGNMVKKPEGERVSIGAEKLIYNEKKKGRFCRRGREKRRKEEKRGKKGKNVLGHILGKKNKPFFGFFLLEGQEKRGDGREKPRIPGIKGKVVGRRKRMEEKGSAKKNYNLRRKKEGEGFGEVPMGVRRGRPTLKIIKVADLKKKRRGGLGKGKREEGHWEDTRPEGAEAERSNLF